MIYDCILYNGEKELLDIRLNETSLFDDWVTTIIVEADKTFMGDRKPLYFERHKELFRTFNIFYLAVDIPDGLRGFEAEAYQRNEIMKGLKFHSPKYDDHIIISDVDEIPRARQINRTINTSILFASLLMDKYAYALNLLESEQTWDRARIMKWDYLKYESRTPEVVRNSGYDFSVHHAGWHWSWVIEPLRKLESFSHSELNTDDNFANVVMKKNFWNDDEFKKIEIDLSHPEYLVKNIDKFNHLLL